MANSKIENLLGSDAAHLLDHTCTTIPKENIHIPGSDFVDRVFAQSNRNPQVLRSIQSL